MAKYNVIKHNGNDYYVNFGMAALSEFCDDAGLKLNDFLTELGQDLSLSNSLKIAFYALKHGGRKAKKEFSLSFLEFQDMVDDEGFELITSIMEKVNDSNAFYGAAADKKKIEDSEPITFEELYLLAMESGVSLTEFWESTIYDISLCIAAYTKRQEREEVRYWSISRWQTTALLNIQLSKNDRLKPTDLFMFDFEKAKTKTKRLVMPIETQKKVSARWDAMMKEKYAKNE